MQVWKENGIYFPIIESYLQFSFNESKTNSIFETSLLKWGVAAWIVVQLVSMRFVLSRMPWMPHKYNADRRNRIPNQKYRVTNWAGYNEGLRRRGDLTVWISDAAPGLWSAPRRTTRGGQPRCSDLVIELCLTLGMVFNQPLRQTQGFMRTIAGLFRAAIEVPDFSTLSVTKSYALN